MEIDQIASTTPLAFLHGRRNIDWLLHLVWAALGRRGEGGALGLYVVS